MPKAKSFLIFEIPVMFGRDFFILGDCFPDFELALVCNERLIWFGDCIARAL